MERGQVSPPAPSSCPAFRPIAAGAIGAVVLVALAILLPAGPIATCAQFSVYLLPMVVLGGLRRASRSEHLIQLLALSMLLPLFGWAGVWVGGSLRREWGWAIVGAPIAILLPRAAGRHASAGPTPAWVLKAACSVSACSWYLLSLGLTSSFYYLLLFKFIHLL